LIDNNFINFIKKEDMLSKAGVFAKIQAKSFYAQSSLRFFAAAP
jgi:hypothetical protein